MNLLLKFSKQVHSVSKDSKKRRFSIWEDKNNKNLLAVLVISIQTSIWHLLSADLLILWTQLWFAYELCLNKYKIDSDFQSLEFFYCLSFPWVQQYSKTLILVSFVIISQTFHVCGFGVLLRSFVRNSLRGFVSHGMSVKFL